MDALTAGTAAAEAHMDDRLAGTITGGDWLPHSLTRQFYCCPACRGQPLFEALDARLGTILSCSMVPAHANGSR